MRGTSRHRLVHALVVATVALLAACDDGALGPERAPASPPRLAVAPDLGACGHLRAPAGTTLALHAYAEGVQIYRWDGASWTFVAPEAVLYADAGAHGAVATHYAGPTWESTSGSTVVGAVADRCTPDASAIPWLSLHAVSTNGPGIFDGTTFIQRVNTVGGKAPAANGSAAGEVARVPYTAEYLFYRGG